MLPNSSFGSNSPAINAYGIISSSYNLQTPAYQNNISPNAQRMAQAPAAYNPEAAGN